MMEKIVITGTGAISSLGIGTDENWKNMLESVSGVGPITLFDTEDFIVKIACEVKNFDPAEYIPGRSSRRRDRFQQFSAVAVKEALEQSGLEINKNNSGRISAIISTGIGGIGTIEENLAKMYKGGPRRVSPFLIPMLMSNGASGMAGIDHGIQGPSFSVASACASGQDGIGIAWMMLRSGMIDVAIAGGCESTITPLGVAAFDRIGACSRRAVDEGTPSPFDKDRDGLVVGEGAGIIVLETEKHAKKRGANILAELAGYAATADANHITAPSEDGIGGSQAMVNAMKNAGVNPDEVNYINAHGTGTPLNDAAETQGIKSAFGDHAKTLMISSTKSMTGHMMGATGALETVMITKAIENNQVPPTINYTTPDPVCDLDYVPNIARDAKVDVALTNAFGFGGHNAVLVIKKYN